VGWVATAEPPAAPLALRLEDCLEMALHQNLVLRIEQLNPVIDRLALDEARGVYDPQLVVHVRREHASDSGGFDLTDFSPQPSGPQVFLTDL
jgi:hypothetical protein